MSSLDNIIGGFAHYQRLQSSNDDDAIDRLNHIYTVTLLVVFAIFVSGKQYVGNAIECFCPGEEFGMSKREYARTYCWLKNTYRISTQGPLPRDDSARVKAEIAYYQWVPIILLLMAVTFKLPNLLWRVFSYNSGMDLNQVASLVISTQMGPRDKSQETMKQVAGYIDRWLEAHRQLHWNAMVRTKKYLSKRCCCFCFWGKRFGTYLTGLYLMTKFLFVLNAVIMMVLLHYTVGEWYVLFGYILIPGLGVSTSSLEDDDARWADSPYFPKVTFCDLDVWQQANKNRYTIQCTLPINMFNEKIFAFLWLWMWVVCTTTVINFLYWIYMWALARSYYVSIQQFLKARGELVTEYDRLLVPTFSHHYLRRDGMFVLNVILRNSNSVVTGELISELWRIYKNKPAGKKGCTGRGDVMYI